LLLLLLLLLHKALKQELNHLIKLVVGMWRGEGCCRIDISAIKQPLY